MTAETAPDTRDAASVLGFLFDANQCTGCSACALACSTENDLGWGVSWRQVVPFNPQRHPGVPSFHLSLACNHCSQAPCVSQCPTGAMARDPATGAVVVNADTCIGCRYCSWVCPYDAPRFDEDQGVMTKCTLCNHRLAGGGSPACAEACPTGALGYGPLSGETLVPGFPSHPWEPRIRFAPLRRDARPPESTWTLPEEVLAAFTETPSSRREVATEQGGDHRAGTPSAARPRKLTRTVLSFRREVPLWIFTTGLAALVGWVGAGALGGPTPPLTVFLGVAAVLLAASTFHLGRPLRAWRALANVRTSALSKEIAWVNAFLGAATFWLASGGGGGPALLPWTPPPGALQALGITVGAVGMLALGQVDAVYRPVTGKRAVHSALTLLTAPLVLAALLGTPLVYWAFAGLKVVFYAQRKRWRNRGQLASVVARLTGLVAVPALWALAPQAWPGWGLLMLGLGEALDRADFYQELDIPGPRQEVRRAAQAFR